MDGTDDDRDEHLDAMPPAIGDEIRRRLAAVHDPDLGVSLVSVGMAEVERIVPGPDGARVDVVVHLTTARCPSTTRFRREIVDRLSAADGVDAVTVRFDELDADGRDRVMRAARAAAQVGTATTSLPPGAAVWAVGSGKGGVGKSTVAAGLALTLAAQGRSVGLIDADVAGHSLPQLIGAHTRVGATVRDGRAAMVPVAVEHLDGLIHVISVGQIVEDPDRALLWRGATVARAVEHLLCDVVWPDEVDVVVVDLPPGTGDVPMTLARHCPSARLLVVTTPSMLAASVAGRVADMAERANLPVTGVVENSSYLLVAGHRHAVFGDGGGTSLAERLGAPLLTQVPHVPALADGLGIEGFDRSFLDALGPVVEHLDGAGCVHRMLRRIRTTLG